MNPGKSMMERFKQLVANIKAQGVGNTGRDMSFWNHKSKTFKKNKRKGL